MNASAAQQIPKVLHFVWVGDEARRPDKWIATWREHHPEWRIRVWGNADLHGGDWINRDHMRRLSAVKSWVGVSNLMRLEVLYRHGGIYIDADSVCLRPLDDWMLESEFFCTWANDLGPHKRLNNAFMGSAPGNPFLRYVIDYLKSKRNISTRLTWRGVKPAKTWRTSGVMPLNDCMESYGYTNATLLPAHMFQPRHRLRKDYTGGGRVYADHLNGATLNLYDEVN